MSRSAITDAPAPSLLARCVAEIVGTFLLVFFGCGSVHAAVLTGAQSGLWQIAVVWGLAIMLAIFVVGATSGAHLNPAMTIALAAYRRAPRSVVLPYIGSQLAGAFLAAAVLFSLFQGFIVAKEQQQSAVRGELSSVVTAMCYGEYYPSPGALAGGNEPVTLDAWQRHASQVPIESAALAELIGTAIFALVVFALTDERNRGGPAERFAPVFIGLTVSALISVLAPLTQACFNPARDFGPRLFAYGAGWGAVAIPGPNGSGCALVYIAAPIAGALLGATVYQLVIRPGRS